MEMKLGIWSSYYMELEPEDAVERLSRNGIDCCELSDEHGLVLLERDDDVVKTGKEFARFLEKMNFTIPQGHLWLYAKICTDSDGIGRLCRWIDLYEAIGIKNMVLHCDGLASTELTKEEKLELNIEKLTALAKRIADKDITVCLENLVKICPDADELMYIIDRVGSDRFGICLDTGHLNLTVKNQREFILKADKKLKALHIADNHGKFDDHLMPFGGGEIDFGEVVQTLREIGYSGLFNLEIPGERSVPLELRDAKIGYIKACFDYLMR